VTSRHSSADRDFLQIRQYRSPFLPQTENTSAKIEPPFSKRVVPFSKTQLTFWKTDLTFRKTDPSSGESHLHFWKTYPAFPKSYLPFFKSHPSFRETDPGFSKGDGDFLETDLPFWQTDAEKSRMKNLLFQSVSVRRKNSIFSLPFSLSFFQDFRQPAKSPFNIKPPTKKVQ
jgi:hypothetical protein